MNERKDCNMFFVSLLNQILGSTLSEVAVGKMMHVYLFAVMVDLGQLHNWTFTGGLSFHYRNFIFWWWINLERRFGFVLLLRLRMGRFKARYHHLKKFLVFHSCYDFKWGCTAPVMLQLCSPFCWSYVHSSVEAKYGPWIFSFCSLYVKWIL